MYLKHCLSIWQHFHSNFSRYFNITSLLVSDFQIRFQNQLNPCFLHDIYKMFRRFQLHHYSTLFLRYIHFILLMLFCKRSHFYFIHSLSPFPFLSTSSLLLFTRSAVVSLPHGSRSPIPFHISLFPRFTFSPLPQIPPDVTTTVSIFVCNAPFNLCVFSATIEYESLHNIVTSIHWHTAIANLRRSTEDA